MTAQRNRCGRVGDTGGLYDLAEPNCDGETRVHRWYFNGLLSAAERETLASLYCAQMTASRVRLLGAPSPLMVEGPLARNTVFVDCLSELLPDHQCSVAADETEGTARGAWLLMHWNQPDGVAPA